MEYETLSALIGDLYVQLKLKDKQLFERDKFITALQQEITILKGQSEQWTLGNKNST